MSSAQCGQVTRPSSSSLVGILMLFSECPQEGEDYVCVVSGASAGQDSALAVAPQRAPEPEPEQRFAGHSGSQHPSERHAEDYPPRQDGGQGPAEHEAREAAGYRPQARQAGQDRSEQKGDDPAWSLLVRSHRNFHFCEAPPLARERQDVR
jgi:hypothetical protein